MLGHRDGHRCGLVVEGRELLPEPHGLSLVRLVCRKGERREEKKRPGENVHNALETPC